MNRDDARSVLLALHRRVDEALRAADPGWRCVRAVPRIDGTLYFDLRLGGDAARLDWVGPVGSGRPPGRGLVLSRSLPDGKRLVERVGRVLGALVQDEDFTLLGYPNREARSVRFDDGIVDFLLAGRLTPGVSSWFGYRFEDVAQSEAERFEITFAHESGAGLVLAIRAAPVAAPGSPLVKNRIFQMHLAHDPRDPASREMLPHQVERFVGFLLSRAVHEDMRLAEPGEGRRSDPAGVRPPDADRGPVASGRWGDPRQWCQFFSDHEIECTNLCALQMEDAFGWVNHGELECMDHEPHVMSGTVSYAVTPWDFPRIHCPQQSRFLVSRLGEQETIRGGTGRLEATLRRALDNPQARCLFVSNTCLPKIIGDDVGSVVERIQSESGVPVLTLSNDLSSPDLTFEDLVVQALQRFVGEVEAGPSEGVNLIGFPPGRDHLVRALEELAIPVNACMLPRIGVDLFRRYPRAGLSVVYPQSTWMRLAERVLRDLGVPLQVLPAPYGMRRTRAWFRAVAEATGRLDAYRDWETRRVGPLLPRWEELRSEATGYGLAFVVEPGQLARLVDPALHYGVELLPLLEEMGFGIHLLIRRDAGRPPPDTGPVTAALADPGRIAVETFAEPDELATLLREGAFQAVYSEVFYDKRVLRAGKAPFHLRLLEMGPEGGLRSLERLLDLCRWDFYGRYQEYLRPGRRTP